MSDSAYERLDRLYARVPSMECKGYCVDQCSVIPLGEAEAQRIAEVGEPMPDLRGTDVETMTLHVLNNTSAVCPNLTDEGRCGVYAVRPMICRVYGVAEGLTCTYGCDAPSIMSRDLAGALIRKSSRIEPDA